MDYMDPDVTSSVLKKADKLNLSLSLSLSLSQPRVLTLGVGHQKDYRQVSNISGTLVGNTTVDHSDVVGASPVGAAPTTSSFSI